MNRALLLFAFGLFSLAAVQGNAVPINYSDFVGTDVTYLQVTEDSLSLGDNTPLFGAPSISGNSLDFDPTGFSAAATGANGVDTTAGNVKFDLVAHAGSYIDDITITEAGNTTLAGFGTDSTFTSVTATLVIDIEEVDGGSFSGGPINVNDSLVFSPSDGDFGMGTDGSGGPTFSSLWTGLASVDIKQILDDANVSYTGGATKVSVTLTNTLVALSEAGTQSFISKQDADSSVKISVNVPEPTSLAMLAAGFAGLAMGRRRS